MGPMYGANNNDNQHYLVTYTSVMYKGQTLTLPSIVTIDADIFEGIEPGGNKE